MVLYYGIQYNLRIALALLLFMCPGYVNYQQIDIV